MGIAGTRKVSVKVSYWRVESRLTVFRQRIRLSGGRSCGKTGILGHPMNCGPSCGSPRICTIPICSPITHRLFVLLMIASFLEISHATEFSLQIKSYNYLQVWINRIQNCSSWTIHTLCHSSWLNSVDFPWNAKTIWSQSLLHLELPPFPALGKHLGWH